MTLILTWSDSADLLSWNLEEAGGAAWRAPDRHVESGGAEPEDLTWRDEVGTCEAPERKVELLELEFWTFKSEPDPSEPEGGRCCGNVAILTLQTNKVWTELPPRFHRRGSVSWTRSGTRYGSIPSISSEEN